MAYTSVEIVVPASAALGAVVNVVAKVKNLFDRTLTITVTGLYDSTEISSFQPFWTWINPLETKSFSASFTMPNKNVRVCVGAWYLYELPDKWAIDAQSYADIALIPADGNGEPPPPDETKIPWTILALIGAAAVLGIVLVRRK